VKGDVRRVREQVVRHVPGASSPATRPPDVDSVTGAEADIEGRVEAERQEAKHHASPQMGPDEPTQAWEPRSDPERPATSTRHDIVDLTEEGEHAAKHAITSPRVEDDDAREDRSIRELFWGED
jgi:hypothetical protein